MDRHNTRIVSDSRMTLSAEPTLLLTSAETALIEQIRGLAFGRVLVKVQNRIPVALEVIEFKRLV